MTRTTFQSGPAIDHYHLGLGVENSTALTEAALAEALANLDITQEVVQNIINETFVTEIVENNEFITQLTEVRQFIENIVNQLTEVTENNEYITQITENQTFVDNFTTLVTNLTEISQNNTYVTNLVTQINAKINAKKGIANELATLDSGGKLTSGQVPTALKTVGLPFFIDGAGSAVTTGLKGGFKVPFACTITGWNIGLEASGSIVIDIWKDSEANYPPLVGDSIVSGSKPTVSSAVKASATGLSLSVAAGDWLFFNVDSADTAKWASLLLTATRTV